MKRVHKYHDDPSERYAGGPGGFYRWEPAMEWFYTMQSATQGLMTVACDDYALMVADRAMALVDPDKSDISELRERTVE